ncbi:MAG: ComEC/Rec2 family competence protein, partial [Simkaniaceae bacterium]|nr:ComEC/Rec2 family competence protein [Simkaniaceae bacterium]
MSIRFFRKHPALALGMYLTIGSGAFFQPVVLFAIIPLLLAEKRASWKGILLTALAFFYTKSLYQLPSDKEVRGDAYFKILSIRTHHTPFTTCMRYEGICVRFQQAGSEIPSAKNIPCSIYVPCKNRPIGNIDYVIKNIDLIKIAPNRHILKLNKSTSWIQAKHSKSFAEKRFTLKKSMQTYLKSHFRNKKVYHLMSALATGHLEHRNLSYEFGRLGLQHVVAISGFHFALIALFFTLFLRIFLSLKALTICLILLVTLYYFYIGNSPSILRAWIGMMVLLIGIALNLKTTGLNLLGIALCYSIITEPILVTNLGFQLSFGATFG